MKKNYLVGLVFLLFGTESVAQSGLETIAEAEMKSASSLVNFQANPNTANYDITYHKLEWTVDPAVYFISGTVTTTFTALEDMSTVTFDLTDELSVSSAIMNGSPLSFIQNVDDELVITLATTLSAGSSATVAITYAGEPATEEDAFTATTHSGTPIIYTLSEPYGAKDWWPCKQDLTDKADSIEVRITAPSQYVSVSNGLQQSVSFSGGNKTTVFTHNYPIPAYLVAIAVTNYNIVTHQAGTPPNEFPIVNYLYPESFAAPSQVAQTLPIMDLFETLFETYPYADEKYGHAQWNVGGGMEHSTVSFMGSFGRELIAHELAHQWFGDKITCGSWNDIWLNEGFATYLSGLVREDFDGSEAFVTWKNVLINSITSAPDGSVYVPDADLDNVSRIFSSRLSYNKGAMVVEMLRWKLGDENFFQGLRNYLSDSDLAYDFAVTPDLKFHLEAISGMDLTEFFNDWVYGEGYPTYQIVADNLTTGAFQITLNQIQSHPSVGFYEMPVPIRVFGADGEVQDLVLEHTSNGQVFTQMLPFEVVQVQFDPERHLISRNNTTTLGVDQFTLVQSIVLHPNPTTGIFQIDIPDAVVLDEVTIFNHLGQIVHKGRLAHIDVSSLAAGVHIVRIATDSGTVYKRLLKV